MTGKDADREAILAAYEEVRGPIETVPIMLGWFEEGWFAAMAAADEREATLKRVEAERDLAVAEAEESEGERCRGVMVRREREREAAREVRALTEALREIGAAASDFDHRTGEAMWANFGRFAHKHALAALPEKPAE